MGSKTAAEKEIAQLVEEERQVKVQRHAAKKFRGPFMLTLLVLYVATMASTSSSALVWIYRYRGGRPTLNAVLEDTLGEKRSVSTKERLNEHAFFMTFSLSLFYPMSVAVKIFLFPSQRSIRVFFIQFFRFLAFASFLLGLVQLLHIRHMSLLRPDGHRSDHSMHLIVSLPAIGFIFIYVTMICFRGIDFCLGEMHDIFLVSRIVWIMSNNLMLEYVERLVTFTGFVSTFTGFLTYLLILFTSPEADLMHVFDEPIPLDENDLPVERHVFTTILASSVLLFLMHGMVGFYEHEILFHTDIITYDMYHKKFIEIADKLMKEPQPKGAKRRFGGLVKVRRRCIARLKRCRKAPRKSLMAALRGNKLRRRRASSKPCTATELSNWSLEYDDKYELSSTDVVARRKSGTKVGIDGSTAELPSPSLSPSPSDWSNSSSNLDYVIDEGQTIIIPPDDPLNQVRATAATPTASRETRNKRSSKSVDPGQMLTRGGHTKKSTSDDSSISPMSSEGILHHRPTTNISHRSM